MSNVFGFVNDNDASLQNTSNTGTIRFGLNADVRVTLAELVSEPENGSPYIQVDLDVNGYRVSSRIYDNYRDLRAGDKVLSPGDAGYQERYDSEMKQKLACITHIVKALGVQESRLVQEITTRKPTSFVEYAEAALNLLPTNYTIAPVDVFLEYEWSIRNGADRTYLILPKNMKGGSFLCPAQSGKWEEKIDHHGLHYENEKGARHPFTRSRNYMESPKANQQTKDGEYWGSTGDSPIEGSKDSLSSW